MIRIYLSGRHSQRTPLSYTWLSSLWEGRIQKVDKPVDADICVFAHCLDVADAPVEVVEEWRLRGLPIVWLSEEPFWDTIWGRNPMSEQIIVDTEHGALPVVQLNHQTCEIFHFDRLPYYLLTNPRFLSTYRRLFTRNASRSQAEWRDHFVSRPIDISFMFERRPETYHDVFLAEGDVYGLCAWRTRLAELQYVSKVERLGASWGVGKSRFELRNWHEDKIIQLDGRARNIAAFENTHQPDYITEKIFDAFACGSRPLYFASPDHRLHEFGLPQESWKNLFDPHLALPDVDTLNAPDSKDFFEAYAAAQKQLSDLVKEEVEAAERNRLRKAVFDAFEGVLETQKYIASV